MTEQTGSSTQPWPAGTPCWVDLSVPDVAAAQRFYGDVFGWSFVDTGEEFGHYAIASVGNGAVAGIGPVMAEGQPSAWTLYVATDDADVTAKLTTEHGGTVLAGPMDIPTSGRMAIAVDPAGAVFGIWQSLGMAGFAPASAEGGVMWEDLRTTDVEGVRRFYAALFGWGYSAVPGMDIGGYGTADLGGRPIGGLGGMFEAPEGTPPHWLTYFGAPDVDAALAAVEAGGGQVLAPAEDTPYGRMAQVRDPFGAVFAVMSAAPPQG